ncbi:MAG: gliding motility protein GldL [Sphingobacteriales bacterium]|jgi:gliding motility-associated protein GldL|nr:gliding motility protein GldL [Sphingobacteriales bacterium]MBP8114871.1 gliding motility protein GldL [Chitinophagaceae bacterium]HNY54283.1 gliding motility protein GldL [Chitinophagales bacterium]
MATPFLKSKTFKTGKNFLFGIGASIVIVGAWAKIMHVSWAGYALTAGLLIEALIFAVSAIIPPEPDYYWEKYYPGLDQYDAEATPIATAAGSGNKKSISGELDKMLDAAKIDQNLVTRFGDNLKGFADNVGKLGNLADATVASNDFALSAKAAATSLNGVKESFSSAADGMSKLAAASGDASQYHSQVQSATKNLAALNAVYEMELQDTNTHLKTMNKFIGNLSTAMTSLEGSIADTEKFKTQMGGLAGNLEKLNGIYGNMLSAMRS